MKTADEKDALINSLQGRIIELEMHLEKRQQNALFETAGLTQEILQASPIGILAYRGDDSQCVLANEAICSIIGATHQQVLAQKFRELASWKCSGFLDHAEEVIFQGGNREGEVQFTSTFGKTVWVRYHFSRFLVDGKPHLLLIICDIIEQKRTEEALRQVREELESQVIERTAELNREISSRRVAQEAMRLSEERYRTIFESTTDALLLLDPGGVICDVNPAAVTLTGFAYSELVGATPEKLVPDHKMRDYRQFMAAIQENRTFVNDTSILRKDGTEVSAAANGTPFSLNNTPYILIVLRDVSERKRAENALHAHIELFGAFMNFMPAFTFIKDRDSRILHVNRHTAGLLPVTDWPGRSTDELFPPDVAAKMIRDDRIAFEQGYLKTEELVARPDGTPHLYETHKFRIDREGEEPILGGISLNITERRQAETALARERDFVSTILDTAEALIMVLDADGRIVRFNKACENVSGYRFDDVRDKRPWEHLTPPDDAEAFRAAFQHIGPSSLPTAFEGAWISKAGGKRIISWSNAVAEQNYIVAIGIDITEQRRTESDLMRHQEQLIQAGKLAALGTLVAGVAHEINNPNSAISMNCTVLTELWEHVRVALEENVVDDRLIIGGFPLGEVKGDVLQLLSGIRDASARIKRIVTDLRHYVRHEKPDMPQPFNINQAVENGLSLLRNQLDSRSIDIVLELAPDLPPMEGSFHRIEQVFVNIIQNAYQSMPDNCGTLTISTEYDPQSNLLTAAVTDDGIGIPGEILRDVTNPFFTTKRDSGGTGLGLSICAGIIKEHSGTLQVESVPGRGTTITVKFPALRETGAAPSTSPPRGAVQD